MDDNHLIKFINSGKVDRLIAQAPNRDDWGLEELSGSSVTDRVVPAGRDPRFFSKVFVVSGSLSALTHQEVRAALETRGALFSRRISQKTDYLVIGRKPGAAAITARIYRIPILTEINLLNLLGLNKQLCLDLPVPDPR
ncbi:MAG: hypothetical protein HQL67_08445 [Magnetococcales bacterium]|nr:hypothetical protein [Magnetococcales bacterium]